MEFKNLSCLIEPSKVACRKPIMFVTIGECWECVSHLPTPKMPYCRLERNGEKQYLHRYVYTIIKGEIPKGMVVRHTCDNTICCNPNHLLLGTQADNMRDMTERNRRTQGNTHKNSKLTEEQAREIKYSKENGITLANKFGITKSVVSNIRSGKAWKHI